MPLLARAHPMRSMSALVVRRDILETMARRTKTAAPLVAGALQELQASVSEQEIGRLIGRVQKVSAPADAGRLGWVVIDISRGALAAGRDLAADHVPQALGPPARDLARSTLTERATRWAEKRSSTLVVAVDEGVKEAIRAVIATGVKANLHTRALTKLVRETIPLDPRRAKSLANMRVRLATIDTPDDVAEKRIARYAAKLLTQRAEVIARTEVFSAINEGRIDLWRELAREKVVEERAIVRQWLTARDERICEICEGIDGATSGLEGDFMGVAGMPPVHPACRCTVTIEVKT